MFAGFFGRFEKDREGFAAELGGLCRLSFSLLGRLRFNRRLDLLGCFVLIGCHRGLSRDCSRFSFRLVLYVFYVFFLRLGPRLRLLSFHGLLGPVRLRYGFERNALRLGFRVLLRLRLEHVFIRHNGRFHRLFRRLSFYGLLSRLRLRTVLLSNGLERNALRLRFRVLLRLRGFRLRTVRMLNRFERDAFRLGFRGGFHLLRLRLESVFIGHNNCFHRLFRLLSLYGLLSRLRLRTVRMLNRFKRNAFRLRFHGLFRLHRFRLRPVRMLSVFLGRRLVFNRSFSLVSRRSRLNFNGRFKRNALRLGFRWRLCLLGLGLFSRRIRERGFL